MKPYKLLIKATLVQQTAFSIGGNMPDVAIIDNPLAKDGKNRYTIRGSGLAGAFIATARQLHFKDLPKNISEGSPQQQSPQSPDSPRTNESVWIFHHAHPVDKENNPSQPQLEIRDNVAIRQKTGAAKDGAKFNSEVLPAETRWTFLLEVDEYRDNADNTASTLALAVVNQWKNHCWLGRDIARGLGWMKLEDVKYYKLDANDATLWPDSSKEPLTALATLKDKKVDHENYATNNIQNKALYDLTGTITINIGEICEDGYGIDFLSVGGIQSSTEKDNMLLGKAFLKAHSEKLIKPLNQQSNDYLAFKDKDVDFNIATTMGLDNKPLPHIPGSSLRGTMRHALSWLHRRNSGAIWEPGGENEYPEEGAIDIVLNMFGSTKQSAKLLISDALPKDDNWKMLVLEMHAEDEFTQGVYAGSKFDRTCLTKGQFEAYFHLTANNEQELKKYKQELEKLATLGRNQMMPLGGGQWKGLGWVKWDIEFNDSNKHAANSRGVSL